MAEDRFLTFAAAVQAMRRHCEGMGLAMGGVLGVAAEPYPHQIATAKHILSATRIRHLIADEVGMGKTVQALMILNVLRRLNPAHRTVILTPPRLMDQWHKECWTRAHVKASVFDGAEDHDEGHVRIINPQTLLSRGDGSDEGFQTFSLDSDYFDLLIVDEIQLMPLEVLDAVQRASRSFRQVLLLSASPRLGEKESRNRILSILEPERTILAESEEIDVDAYIDHLEDDAISRISDAGLDEIEAFESFARSRRIVRSTRKQWRKYFPKRIYKTIPTDPNDADIKRLEYGLEWLRTNKTDRDRWSAAQRMHRGSRSVKPFLSRADPSGSEAGQLALAQCDTGPGDSRLDSLLDLLRSIWESDPTEQIVIVAGDNPTIDFVKGNIERYFNSEVDLIGISELRRQAGSANSELQDIEQMQEAMARFSAGQDRVLFVGDWVQAGLNLHYYARNIIFYNTPWNQNAVDQLIGRLDRLRPNALFMGEQGRKFEEVCIWTIFQPDSPESKVIAGLEMLGVFLDPMPPVAPETEDQIRACLEDLAAGRKVKAALSQLEDINRTVHETARISKLDQFGPALTDLAKQQYQQLQTASVPEPVISFLATDTFTQKTESAVVGWLEFLKRSKLFDVGRRTDKSDPNYKFSTIWYDKPTKDSVPLMRLNELEGDSGVNLAGRELKGNWNSHHVPFICRLKDLHRPPVTTVHTVNGEPEGRPLRFLSHGDALHDELIEKSIKLARPGSRGTGETIRFDPENGAAKHFRGKQVFASAALADPALIGLPSPTFAKFREEALQIINSAPGRAQRDRLKSLLDLAGEWWNADRRWLSFQLEPVFETIAVFLDESDFKTLPASALADLLKADADKKEARFPRAYGPPYRVDPSLFDSAVGDLQSSHRARVKTLWQGKLNSLQEAVSRRLAELTVEQDDFLRVLRMNVERAWKRTKVEDERQSKLLSGQADAAERTLKLAELSSAARRLWLKDVPAQLEKPEPDYLGTVLFRPVPFQDF